MAFVVTCSVVPIHVFLHLTFGCLILSFIHNESFDVVYANHIEYVVCSLSFPKCLHFLSLPFIPFPFLCYGVFPASLKQSSTCLFTRVLLILFVETSVHFSARTVLFHPSLFDLYPHSCEVYSPLVSRDLSFNAFSGDLPRSFSLLTNLRYL